MKKSSSASTINLSAETAKALDALVKRFGVDRSEMVERLIFGTAPAQENSDAIHD